MTTKPTAPPLTQTKLALEAYDADEPRRDLMLDEAITTAAIKTWQAEEAAALEKVRRAFHADTADRNTWSQAKHIDLATIRRWLAEGWS
jgi:hypothetical protein